MHTSGWLRGLLTLVVTIPLGLSAAHAAGDAAAGKEKSVACMACHVGIAAASDVPQLVGQREAYLAKQLKAFKAGERKNDSMAAIAAQLSEADIANLAAYWASQPAGSDATAPDAATAIKRTHMAFPKDFPKGYTLYLTSNNAEASSVSRSYINAVGFKAAKANKPLPDGTVIVVEHAAAKLDADKKPVVEKDGSWAIDKITRYATMEARAGWGKDIPELLRNANWNYGIFKADKAPQEVNQAVCLACHKPQAAVNYVFTFKELREKAGAK